MECEIHVFFAGSCQASFTACMLFTEEVIGKRGQTVKGNHTYYVENI